MMHHLDRPLAGWTSLALPDDELVDLFVDVAATEARVEELPRLTSLLRRALACVALLSSGEEDEVTNTAFVVRGELRRRQELLDAAQGTDCLEPAHRRRGRAARAAAGDDGARAGAGQPRRPRAALHRRVRAEGRGRGARDVRAAPGAAGRAG
jgi:hypothetical protein